MQPSLVAALRCACAYASAERQPALFVAAMQLLASACAADLGLADALLFPTELEGASAPDAVRVCVALHRSGRVLALC